jgi:AraC-like DNA-binding protein
MASANYKVFEVAEMVGFYSSSSFCKAFLKKYKVTPIAYQRSSRIVDLQS